MPATVGIGGHTVVVKIKDSTGSPAFQAVAGLRTRSISANAEVVDITNSDSTNLFREILDNAGIRSLSIKGAGIFQDVASMEAVRAAFFNNALKDAEFVVPTFGTMACKVKVSAFELAGEYNGAVSFNLAFESSGDVTFTAV